MDDRRTDPGPAATSEPVHAVGETRQLADELVSAIRGQHVSAVVTVVGAVVVAFWAAFHGPGGATAGLSPLVLHLVPAVVGALCFILDRWRSGYLYEELALRFARDPELVGARREAVLAPFLAEPGNPLASRVSDSPEFPQVEHWPPARVALVGAGVLLWWAIEEAKSPAPHLELRKGIAGCIFLAGAAAAFCMLETSRLHLVRVHRRLSAVEVRPL